MRDLSKVVTLPSNNFEVIDNKVRVRYISLSHTYWLTFVLRSSQASEFDDMRQCHACKQICIFSAVACECDRNKVACIRHFPTMCRCPPTKKFLLGELCLSCCGFYYLLMSSCWVCSFCSSSFIHSQFVGHTFCTQSGRRVRSFRQSKSKSSRWALSATNRDRISTLHTLFTWNLHP